VQYSDLHEHADAFLYAYGHADTHLDANTYHHPDPYPFADTHEYLYPD
jgi:hypothetical protein